MRVMVRAYSDLTEIQSLAYEHQTALLGGFQASGPLSPFSWLALS